MADNRMKSFTDLKSMKFKDNNKDKEEDLKMPKSVRKVLESLKKKPKPEIVQEQEEAPVEEEMAFLNAMSGVKKMDSSTVKVERIKPVIPVPPPKEDGNEYLSSLVSGNIEFEIEYSEEFMYGHVCGIDSKIFQKLKAGSFNHEAQIDLHGMNSEQAFDNLMFFIRESFLEGHRCLLAVTGKGKNSPGGQSVLKREIQEWLTRDPFRRVVLAFCSAQPKDGGTGAIYILLRRQKKVKGKVKWDKGINWDE
ncbi:DNA-nicking endonuclease, Smr domain [Maridesulfovibrio ferrireducens]|uniref:DNA-nicking endonuclease, Smr domain n=1 Tax=Maridesulfovibrio ferrireducens TaxID=246191 RepID=A0A1G9HWI6_9BACT|nr:Smr/MutS family protein [Maridesulfovibrio ferrireducens]SDL17367.1 DNA-nicking endonuclease, Smr domain [Maridesulfovibrio ferrireducens]